MAVKGQPGMQIRQQSAAEVAQMTPQKAWETRQESALQQRGRGPEQRMDDYQTLGGGVKSVAMEHVGDLTHRMNKNSRYTDVTMGDVMPKVRSQYDNLHSRYGFEREHYENLRANKTDYLTEEWASQKYADAHKTVPVYNYPSEVAREAAVSLGEGRYDDTRNALGTLRAMEEGGKGPDGQSWAEGDMRSLLELPRPSSEESMQQHQTGMVDYLRGKESRTPAITNAATVMLGGQFNGR